jgi:hypothetical protein
MLPWKFLRNLSSIILKGNQMVTREIRDKFITNFTFRHLITYSNILVIKQLSNYPETRNINYISENKNVSDILARVPCLFFITLFVHQTGILINVFFERCIMVGVINLFIVSIKSMIGNFF